MEAGRTDFAEVIRCAALAGAHTEVERMDPRTAKRLSRYATHYRRSYTAGLARWLAEDGPSVKAGLLMD